MTETDVRLCTRVTEVGETFVYDGKIYVTDDAKDDECIGCAFEEADCFMLPRCSRRAREDGKDIIYRLVYELT